MSALGLKLNHQIDLDTRTIYLVGSVDSEMYLKLVNGFMAIPSGSVTIVLNTDGGCVYQAFAIHDLIKSRGNCTIVTEGQCMSAGIIILMAAAYKLSRPNCFFLIHYGEDSNRSQLDVKHNIQVTRIVKNMLAETVTAGRRKISTWFDKETYFTAEQAASVGLIDGVTHA